MKNKIYLYIYDSLFITSCAVMQKVKAMGQQLQYQPLLEPPDRLLPAGYILSNKHSPAVVQPAFLDGYICRFNSRAVFFFFFFFFSIVQWDVNIVLQAWWRCNTLLKWCIVHGLKWIASAISAYTTPLVKRHIIWEQSGLLINHR